MRLTFGENPTGVTFPATINQECILLSRDLIRDHSNAAPPSLVRFGHRIRGPLNADMTQAALLRLVQRHAALRVRFSESPLILPKERGQVIRTFATTTVLEHGLFMQTVEKASSIEVISCDIRDAEQCDETSA